MCSLMFSHVFWCPLMFPHVLWCSLMFAHVLSWSLMFSHVLWSSLMFSHVLSCSLKFSDVLSCSYMLSFFTHVLASPFTHMFVKDLSCSMFSDVFSHLVFVMFVLSWIMLWKCGITLCLYVPICKLSKRSLQFFLAEAGLQKIFELFLNSKAALGWKKKMHRLEAKRNLTD